MMTFVLICAGIVLLVAGAELLVKGSSALAAALGLSPLVIGLTIVAFGTSAPELFVSTKAALAGQPDIALGNVIGSNIFNVLFILGISALIAPLVVSQQLVRWDVPVMIGISFLVLFFSMDGEISVWEGGLFLTGLGIYTLIAILMGNKESSAVKQEYAEEFGVGEKQRKKIGFQLVLIMIGLVLLVFGAKWFVEGAVMIARSLGISELVIALTVVAAGTSLPEVAASIMATIKGERDIAVGNVVGSNIFNILGILGVSGILSGAEGMKVSPAAFDFDIPVMIAVAAACLPVFFTGHRINRWEGGLFLLYYVAYAAYLILKAGEHDALPWFSHTMLYFVIPITGITLMVITSRYLGAGKNRNSRIK